MKLLSSLLLAHGAVASNLFGRTISHEQRGTLVKRDLDSEALSEIRGFMEFETYLDTFMSMSMSYPGGNGSGSGGTGSPSSKSPSAPTSTPLTVSPSLGPSTVSVSPSKTPPTSSPSPVSLPTSSPGPVSEAPSLHAAELSLFECSDQGLVVPAGTRASVTTLLSLAVLLEAESTANTTNAFLSDLESALFSIALIAALDCDGKTQRRELKQVTTVRRHLMLSTNEVGYCTLIESIDNTCFTLEMHSVFEINDDVDPDHAALSAYTALQSAMVNYQGYEIHTVKRLTYLAPTPIEPSTPPISRSSKPSFLPLAIGACVAMVCGGMLALYVWVHKRRTRSKQHVELPEDRSLSLVERT